MLKDGKEAGGGRRLRMVDEAMKQMRSEIQQMDDKHESNNTNMKRAMDENHAANNSRIDERHEHCRSLDAMCFRHQEIHTELHAKIDTIGNSTETRVSKLQADLMKQDEDLHKEVNDRVDGIERCHHDPQAHGE